MVSLKKSTLYNLYWATSFLQQRNNSHCCRHFVLPCQMPQPSDFGPVQIRDPLAVLAHDAAVASMVLSPHFLLRLVAQPQGLRVAIDLRNILRQRRKHVHASGIHCGLGDERPVEFHVRRRLLSFFHSLHTLLRHPSLSTGGSVRLLSATCLRTPGAPQPSACSRLTTSSTRGRCHRRQHPKHAPIQDEAPRPAN